MTGERSPASVRVSAMLMRALVESFRHAGGDVPALIERAQIDAARLADVEAKFSLPELETAVLEALALSGDPAFGLHWGESAPMMQFGIAGPLLATVPTLRSALDAVQRIQPIFLDRLLLGYAERGSRAVLALHIPASSLESERVASEMALAALVRALRYLGQEGTIRAVNFRYPRPAHGAEYGRIFGAHVRFDRPESSIELARAALDRPLPLAAPEEHRALSERAAALSRRSLVGLTQSERVRDRVRAALPRLLSITEVARSLALSPRSLRRALEQEQTHFRALVDDVQRERHEELRAQDKSVKELAHALGFASVSGFYRATKRWQRAATQSP